MTGLLVGWMGAPTREVSIAHLRENAEVLLAEWAAYLAGKVARQMPGLAAIEPYARLLEDCVKLGIDAAYDALEDWPPSGPGPD